MHHRGRLCDHGGAIYVIGQTVGNVGEVVVIVFLAGTFMNTAQASLPALAAVFYGDVRRHAEPELRGAPVVGRPQG